MNRNEPDLDDVRSYCEMRADERTDPFLAPGESARPWTSSAAPATSWRDLPPTDKQVRALRRFQLPESDLAEVKTRGRASDLLSQLIKQAKPTYDDSPWDHWGDL